MLGCKRIGKWRLVFAIIHSAIASNLVDKLKNGNRSIEQLVEHMTRDSLVQWAWAPGAGRSIPAVSRKEFHEAVKTWAQNGAVIK